jgi:hypothetical protein
MLGSPPDAQCMKRQVEAVLYRHRPLIRQTIRQARKE